MATIAEVFAEVESKLADRMVASKVKLIEGMLEQYADQIAAMQYGYRSGLPDELYRYAERTGEKSMVMNRAKIERDERWSAKCFAQGACEKMTSKLTDQFEVVSSTVSASGDMVLTGTLFGHAVEIRQQVVFKWSRGGRFSMGKQFVQFPARIYVDGKFTPEKDYKAFVAAAALSNVLTAGGAK